MAAAGLSGELCLVRSWECSNHWKSERRLSCKIKSPLQQLTDVELHEFFVQNNNKILHNKEFLGYHYTAIQLKELKGLTSLVEKGEQQELPHPFLWECALLQLLWEIVGFK